jgi:hypothetical protein
VWVLLLMLLLLVVYLLVGWFVGLVGCHDLGLSCGVSFCWGVCLCVCVLVGGFGLVGCHD